MILVPFVPFFLTLFIGYTYFKASLKSQTISHMERIVADHGQMIEAFLNERKSDLVLIERTYSFSELQNPEILRKAFYDLQGVTNAFSDLGVFDRRGMHVAYHGPFELTGKNYRDTVWFNEVMQQGFYISDVFLGYRRIPHFVVAVAREEDGTPWVLRATIDSQMFNQLVKKVRLGRTGEAYILNEDGVLQTERRSGGEPMEKLAEAVRTPHSGGGILSQVIRAVDGENYLYTSTRLKNTSWLLVVRQEVSDAFIALRTTSMLVVPVVIIGGLIICLAAVFLTRRIVGRMRQVDAESSRLGEQLIGATRLAELGEMSAGFAHEINNPLQIINGEHTLIEMNLEELGRTGAFKQSELYREIKDSMDQIKLQISRCSEITQAILKFGRRSEPAIQAIDLPVFVPEVLKMIAKKASVHGIDLEPTIDAGTEPVNADPAQLQQVLLNLLNNAVHAITARHGAKGGRLTVSVKNRDDGSVQIGVEDNGCGISSDNLKKIFSPFFTTKPVGQGTGLGLSVCYGIVDKLGGRMEVDSREGEGTVFRVILPVARESG
jgi:two-component system NtrC family sensor kinase